MALNNNALNLMADALKAGTLYLSLHSADPGSTGTNETTAARVAASWGATANGDYALSSPAAFTGGAASGACTHVGVWSASSSGTFYGGAALTGDQTFNAAGEYTVSALTVAGAPA